MDRNALVLYLKNIRDLEVSRDIVGRMYNRDKRIYENEVNRINSKKHPIYKIPDFKYEPRGGCFVFSAFMVVMYVLCSVFLIIGMAMGELGSMEWLLFSMIGGAILFGIIMKNTDTGSRKNQEEFYKKKVEAIKIDNEKAAAQNTELSKSIQTLYNEWLKKNEWYKKEYSRITGIINDFYAMNIIPKQYRNISATIFLYDYMSSSQESFQMALISNHIEDGIRRIEAKLDTVIEMVREDIFETRLMREENKQQVEQTISQNNQMLQHLESIENNSYEASQYAKLASNYSKANAYFSLAKYLDNDKK